MSYSEELAARVRALLADRDGILEKKMFGGLSFLLAGNMCCGVIGDDLVVRVGPEAHRDALESPHSRPMDFTGRALKGFIYVDSEGTASDEALEAWLERGLDFAAALPPK